MKSIDELLERLDKVKSIGHGEYEALCPAHSDKNPSLHIKLATNKILINCKAGCATSDVLTALHLSLKDLYLANDNASIRKAVATYSYHDLDGNILYDVVRFEPKTFRQRHYVNGEAVWNIDGITPVLYHLPDIITAKTYGDTIYLVEGEKDADRLWDLGLVATTNPMGAGKWNDNYTETLAGAKSVVIIADKDDVGRRHAKDVAIALEDKVQSLKVLELQGTGVKDVSDWLNNGGTIDLLEHVIANIGQFTTIDVMTARDLVKMDFPPIKWVIPDILPDGTTILAGKPKAGKSVLVMNIALAVASGGMALGNIPVEQGSVLYLSLEDGKRRGKERLLALLEGDVPPDKLSMAFTWDTIDNGGIEAIEKWLLKHNDARLVIVDTLKRIKPKEIQGQTLYGSDYDSIAPLSELAKKHNISIVINHHTNKMRDADDYTDLISGSTGLTGAVDNAFVIRRGRGTNEATLFTCGRDIEDKQLALRLNYPCWIYEGESTEASTTTNERKEVIEYLQEYGGSSIKAIAEATGNNYNTAKTLLWRMANDKDIYKQGGKYYVEL